MLTQEELKKVLRYDEGTGLFERINKNYPPIS